MADKEPVPLDAIHGFCRQWGVVEFSLFGSILRNDFGPESDVDVLVRFAPTARHDIFADAEMIEQLEGIFGRRVDLVEEDMLRNPFRRHEILRTRRVLYAA